MLSVSVIEALDILEHFVLHPPSSFNIRAVNGFNRERMKEAFSDSVVPAVALRAHILTGLQQAQGPSIRIKRILHPLVGIDNQSGFQATPGYSPRKLSGHQRSIQYLNLRRKLAICPCMFRNRSFFPSIKSLYANPQNTE